MTRFCWQHTLLQGPKHGKNRFLEKEWQKHTCESCCWKPLNCGNMHSNSAFNSNGAIEVYSDDHIFCSSREKARASSPCKKVNQTHVLIAVITPLWAFYYYWWSILHPEKHLAHQQCCSGTVQQRDGVRVGEIMMQNFRLEGRSSCNMCFQRFSTHIHRAQWVGL